MSRTNEDEQLEEWIASQYNEDGSLVAHSVLWERRKRELSKKKPSKEGVGAGEFDRMMEEPLDSSKEK